MILCDIGNTTYHFKVNDSCFKKGLNEDLDHIVLRDFDEVYFISVNEKGTEKFLQRFPHAINLQKWVSFDTMYSSTLGIDRIFGSLLFDNAIIVDFGSAVTIDVMENKKHLGGYILPGYDALSKIYPMISSKLAFEFDTNIDLDRLPHNTNEAISYAIIKMVRETILDIKKRYDLQLIITGETAKIFLPFLESYEYYEDLLFKGMEKIIKQNRVKHKEEIE